MSENQEPNVLQLLSEIAAHPDVFDVQLGVHGHKNGDVWAVIISWCEDRPNNTIRCNEKGPLEVLSDIKYLLDFGTSLDDMEHQP